jgi:hypothetical protein
MLVSSRGGWRSGAPLWTCAAFKCLRLGDRFPTRMGIELGEYGVNVAVYTLRAQLAIVCSLASSPSSRPATRWTPSGCRNPVPACRPT